MPRAACRLVGCISTGASRKVRRRAREQTAGPWPRATGSRLAAIVRLMLLFSRTWISGNKQPSRDAARFRSRLEELGGAWVKLGQALALRRDLLPYVYCDEFAKLLDEVPPFDVRQAERVINEDLGASVSTLFCEFEPVPIASASIGQVHRAWRHGIALAVKVQRPNIGGRFKKDFFLFARIAWLCDKLRLGAGTTTFRDALSEFESWTWRELDYREEAFSARLLGHNAGTSGIEAHIASYPELSSRRVLTMQMATGMPLVDIVNSRRRGSAGPNDQAAPPLDLRQIAEHLLWNTLNQIYRFGTFHSDPHPANLFIDANNGIVYVDHGQIGRIGGAARGRLLRFAWSLAEERFDAAVGHLLEIASPSERTDVADVRREAELALARHVEAMRYGSALDRLDTMPLDLLVMDLARRHRLNVGSELTLFFKTISTVDSVVRDLVPELDLFSVQLRFFSRLTTLELCESLNPERQLATVRKVLDAVNEVIAITSRLDDTADSADRFIQTVYRRQRQLSFLVLAIAGGATLYGASSISSWKALTWQPAIGWLLLGLAVIVAGHVVTIVQSSRLRDTYDRSTARRRRVARRAAKTFLDG